MGKKKQTESAPLLPAAYPAESPWWPEEFAPKRFALMHGVFLVLLAVILYIGSVADTLVIFKEVAGWALGIYDPLNLGVAVNDTDVATLIFCFFLVTGNALIHPSIGLATLALLRPWLDGYTFKTDNVYFLWGAVFILALWGVRAVMRNEPVRLPVLTGLSVLYLFVALLLSPWSINFGETFKQILNWTGYAAVFTVTAQNLRTPRVQFFVLFTVLMGMALQAAFAVMQYHYVLPYLRELISKDPNVLKMFFPGVDQVTPEMAHRFNRNRAFGTVLFPNALAAFLILGIPGCFALALNVAGSFLPSWERRGTLLTSGDAAHIRRCAATASVLWLGMTVLLLAAFQFPATYTMGTPAWYLDLYALAIGAALLACIPAGLYYFVAARHGFPLANQGSLFISLGIGCVMMLWALWLSFSRGGTLALAAAVIITLIITFLPKTALSRMVRLAPRAAALLLCVGMAALFLTANRATEARLDTSLPALAAQAQMAQQSSQITRQGQNVGMADLASTESFKLRVEYWRVGWRMFADNWLLGVGLGAYKWAYPVYQHPGEGNVQETHNSYLQALSETGILGGVAQVAFWIWLMLWLVRRIADETDKQRRRLLIGLFGGLLAFLLHAGIDINFQHPTLMFYAMLFAALAAVVATREETPVASARVRMPILGLLLIGAMLAVGFSTRPYLQNLALSRMQFIAGDVDGALMERFMLGQYLLVGSPTARLNKKSPAPITVRLLSQLKVDLPRYMEISRQYEPGRVDGRLTPLAPGAKIEPESQLMFEKPWKAAIYMEEDLRGWIGEIERQDSRFPHDPQLALHLSNWYQALTHFPENPWLKEKPDDYYGPLIEWSDAAIARNPLNADVYVNKVRSVEMLWYRDRASVEPLREMVALQKKASELAPAQQVFQYQLADELEKLAAAVKNQGNETEAAQLRVEAQAARSKGWDIATTGLPDRVRYHPPAGMGDAPTKN